LCCRDWIIIQISHRILSYSDPVNPVILSIKDNLTHILIQSWRSIKTDAATQRKKPQIMSPRVTPLEGVPTYAPQGIRVRGVENMDIKLTPRTVDITTLVGSVKPVVDRETVRKKIRENRNNWK